MFENVSVDTNDIATNIAAKVAEDSVSFFWNKVKKFFKDCGAKKEIDLRDAYETYLERTKEKYGKIKTLIYNRIKEELYSFYVNIKLEYKNKETIDSSDINNVLNLSNKIIISGTGGIGKSTLMHHMFLNTIEMTNFIPVLIELRSFNSSNDDISIREYIFNTLSNHGFSMEDEYYEYSLNEGGYVFLFDGFDEVKQEFSNKLAKAIQDFSDRYHNNHFIVSSRPSQRFIGWNDYDEVTTIPLTKEQAIELISKIKFDSNVKDKFIEELDSVLFEKHKSFAQNPLLLTIMLLTYESNAKIPETLNDFYERAFHVLFSEHDATKNVFKRETCTKLNYDKFKLVFSYLCFVSYLNREFELTDVSFHNYLHEAQKRFPDIVFDTDDFQQDLMQHVCVIIKDGISYRFVHRSFQEYFAAFYTANRLIDDIQTKLFKSKLCEDIIAGETFYNMLYEMQPERFLHNILLPGLKELKDQNGNDQFTVKTLELLYNDFYLSRSIDINDRFSISLSTRLTQENNNKIYFCNIMYLTDLLGFTHISLSEEQKVKKSQIIKERLGTKNSIHNPINILNCFNEAEIDLVFNYSKYRFLNAMKILEKHSNQSLALEDLSVSGILSSI